MKHYLLILLLIALQCSGGRILEESNGEEEISQVDQDTQEEDLSLFSITNFQNTLQKFTKDSEWEGEKEEKEADDMTFLKLIASTEENSKALSITFEIEENYIGSNILDIQCRQEDTNFLSTFKLFLNEEEIDLQACQSGMISRKLVEVTLITGENSLKIEALSEDQSSQGILIEYISLHPEKHPSELAQGSDSEDIDEDQEESESDDGMSGDEYNEEFVDGFDEDESSGFGEQEDQFEDEQEDEEEYDYPEYDSEEEYGQVYAVESGACNVAYSSASGSQSVNYWLDYEATDEIGWSPSVTDKKQWIQIGCEGIKEWKKIILQGGRDDSWVSKLKISYTINGKSRSFLNKTYHGCYDNHTKIQIIFQNPIYARSLRLHPVTWVNEISLRFEAIYKEKSQEEM